MKGYTKLLKKAGPFAGVILATVVILLLTRQQPKLNEQKALPQPVVSNNADKQLELVEMRAEPFIQLLQKVLQKNPGTFSFNTGDTTGKRFTIRYSDEQTVKPVLFNDMVFTQQQLGMFKTNNVVVLPGEIDLPISRNNGVLLVRVPSVMAFSMARQQ